MTTNNCKLIDPETGLFSVLDSVSLHLGGPYWWHSEDIDEATAVGVIFRAFPTEVEMQARVERASITIVDVSDDPTEPQIDALTQADLKDIDVLLHDGIAAFAEAQGRRLIRWMSSQLNQTADVTGLMTAYIMEEGGRELQHMALRLTIPRKNFGLRKFVVLGIFDIASAAELAAPIYNTMRAISILPRS